MHDWLANIGFFRSNCFIYTKNCPFRDEFYNFYFFGNDCHDRVSFCIPSSVNIPYSNPEWLNPSCLPVSVKSVTAATTAALAVGVTAKKFLDKGSRKYTEDSVATEYDAWTQDGILEYYWGEHIHLGYYNSEEMAAGYKKKNFIEAKYDFTREMMSFGGMDKELIGQDNLKVLDVGCGVGGTSRFIAKQLTGKNTEVRG